MPPFVTRHVCIVPSEVRTIETPIFGIILTIIITLLFLLIPIYLYGNRRRRNERRQRQRRRPIFLPAYDENGKNAQGQYNRYYDVSAFRVGLYSADGFLDPRKYPLALTDHGRQRMAERLGISNHEEQYRQAFEAYQFGKSALQLPASAAARLTEKQSQYGHSVILLYRNQLYVFSPDNVLITVYQNEDIIV